MVAALLAAWRISSEKPDVASSNRRSCSRAKPSSVSAVARCVISPTTSGADAVSSESPQRPMPVSSFTWQATPSGTSPSATTSSSLASRAAAISRFVAGPMTRIRVYGNSVRSSSASPTVVTQSADAPAPSAAPATSTAPWP